MAQKKKSAKSPEELKFEDAMAELELIVKEMEEGGLTLEESIEKFERGIKLSEACSKKLEEADLKVEKLMRGTDGDIRRAGGACHGPVPGHRRDRGPVRRRGARGGLRAGTGQRHPTVRRARPRPRGQHSRRGCSGRR